MNIHVVRPDGSWYARPDTTLVRDDDRFFLPDDCTATRAVRACCIRIAKAGKAVAPQFVRRYYDGCAESILFYGVLQDGGDTPFLDRSTWVSRDFRPAETLDTALREQVAQGLCRISRHLSLRIGDFLIFELSAPAEFRRGDQIDNIAIL